MPGSQLSERVRDELH